MNKISPPLLFFCFICCFLFFTISDVSADNTDIYERGDTLSFGVTLLQNGTYGDPVPNQKIQFYDETENTLLGFSITDETGYACIEWTIPYTHSLGPTLLNATFRGNQSEYLYPSVQFYFFELYSSTTANIEANASIYVPDDFMQLDVSVFDDSGFTLGDVNVSVFFEDTILDTSTTNQNGSTSFRIKCELDVFSLGDNQLLITVHDDSNRFYSSSSSLYTFEIHKLETQFHSNYSEIIHASLNDSSSFHFQLASFDSPIAGVPITILIDYEVYEIQQTNESGFIDFFLEFDESFELFNHSLAIVFDGNSRYNTVTTKHSIILSSPLAVISTNSSYILNELVSINVTVSDIFNRTLYDLNVVIHDLSLDIFHYPIDSLSNISAAFRFEIVGKKGLRKFAILIQNQFVNQSVSYIATIWSRPTITLINSSIDGYAFPRQVIHFEFTIINETHPLSHCVLYVLLESSVLMSIYTTVNGLASFDITCPSETGKYQYVIQYDGNETRYETPVCFIYSINICEQVPLTVLLIDRFTSCPLQQIHLDFSLIGLNGVAAENMGFTYEWLNISHSVVSNSDGYLHIVIPMPNTSGCYILKYEIEENSRFLNKTGIVAICISHDEILASQGIGLPGIFITSSISTLIVCIPFFRRKYLLS
ncbi:MAG: hypothetical protein GF411_05590 [Candidatus Lokiarchaeota archaeon]|nr:hypothetical protein [Candidatus Lokiarchaeota archaeon]